MPTKTDNSCEILIKYLSSGGSSLSSIDFWKSLSVDYQNKLTRVIRSYESEQNEPLTGYFSDWIAITDHFIATKSLTLKAASYRAIKAPLNKVLNKGLRENLLDDEIIKASLAALKKSMGIAASKIDNADRASSSKKEKSITPDEIYAIRMYARQSTPIARFAIQWLEFNVLTNCRPNELQEARLVLSSQNGEPSPYLTVRNTVKNNKTKQNIADGTYSEYRNIELDQCSYHDLIFIDKFIANFQEKLQTLPYESIYRQSRESIRSISQKSVGKTYSLSVGRNQWAANSKSIGVEKEDIAQRMGHTNLDQATRSYGRKSKGWQKAKRRSEE